MTLVAGCSSGGNAGGPGAHDASLDTGTGAEAGEDSGVPRDTGAGGDAPSEASDAGASDAGDGATIFGAPICTPRSGTRIKARFYKGTEGTLIFDSMYDSMLNVRCSPILTSDGKLRCGPQLPTYYPSWNYFSDPGCKDPLLNVTYMPCGSGPYAALLTNSTCLNGYTNGGLFSFFQIGAEVADGGPVSPSPDGGGNTFTNAPFLTDGGCTLNTSEGEPLYQITPVPDSTFVEGVSGQITAGRYSMHTVTFSDGALFCDDDGDFLDSTLGAPTHLALASDNTGRLLPDVPPPVGFSEGTCTTPATVVPPTGPCGAPAPFTSEAAVCTGARTIRSVGAALDAGFEMTQLPDGGTACVPDTPEAGTWNAVSAPLAPTMFGEAFYQYSGTGRLQYIDRATADGFRWRLEEAFDSQLQTNCTTNLYGGPTERCIPFEYQASSAYSDSKCTQPMYYVATPKSCTPPAGSFAWVDACPIQVLHVGAPLTTVYVGSPGYCNAYDDPTQDFYQTVDDIPPNGLEQMTLVVQ